MNHEPSSIAPASRFPFHASRFPSLGPARKFAIRNSHFAIRNAKLRPALGPNSQFAIRNVSPPAFWSPHVSLFTFPDSRRSAPIRNSQFAIRNVSPSALWSPHVSLFTFPDSRHSPPGAPSPRFPESPCPRFTVSARGSRHSALPANSPFDLRNSQSLLPASRITEDAERYTLAR
jgi:hypothetical protein